MRSSRIAKSNFAVVDPAVHVGHPHHVTQRPDRLRRHTSPADPGDRRHARIVPTGHVAFVDQPDQLPLAEDRVVELQPRELGLFRPWWFDAHGIEDPVVDLPVVAEFQRAERVRDLLDRVLEAVRVVVHRIQTPFVPSAIVRRVADAQQQRVPHHHVGMGQVDLRPQHVRLRSGTRRPSCAAAGPDSHRAIRSRYGLGRPGSVTVPRSSRISSSLDEST